MHFNSVLTLTPGISRVVYLEAIQVEGYTLDQVDELKQKVYNLMDQGLRRYRNYPPA
jgi:1-acyl-sn-glycerol-3-phosphate acyltransferase